MLTNKLLTTDEIDQVRKISMIFVLGKERSGTSLLQNLLNAHPDISGGPESRFAQILYPRYKHIKKWSEANIVDFVEKLYLDPMFTTFWSLDKRELISILLPLKDVADYSLLCKMVYYQERNGKDRLKYISDKNPEHILYLDTIEKIFHDVKYIHIIREPRDNIYSQVTSFKTKNVKFRAYQWLAFNSIVEERKKREPGRYFTVLYENLVNNTEGTMKLICEFLEISFTDSMLQNKTPGWLEMHIEKEGIKDKEKMAHRNLLKPVNTSNIGKWKNKMDPFDQAITEVITGDFAHKTYGYDIDNNRKSKPVNIPIITLLTGKVVYYSWQNFKQWKAKSFRFNLFYSNLKKRMNKNMAIWEYF